MKDSASSTWSESSRTNSRTRTLVSTARMLPADVFSNRVLGIHRRPWRNAIRKQRLMYLLGAVAASPAHDHLIAFFVPLQDRSRPDPEPLTNFRGHRDLAL